MASGETLLKITDFPFSYSLMAIIFSAIGSDFQGANLFIYAGVAGSLGTFLTIIDPVGRVLRLVLRSSFKKSKKKTNDSELNRKLDHTIKALRTRSVGIEIDKLVALCYFGITLFLFSSLIAHSSQVAEKSQILDNQGKTICDTTCISHVGNVVATLGTLIIGAVGTMNYRDIKKFSQIAGIYHLSINLETVTRSTIDSMTKTMEVNDWETAAEWATRIQNEITERKGEQNKIEQLIDVVYKPLSDECLAVIDEQDHMLKTRFYRDLSNGVWRKIKTLPIYYRLDDAEIAAEIDELYELKNKFNNLVAVANKRVLEIIEEEGSKIYGTNVKGIYYFFNSKNGEGAPDLQSCLMFGIHPRDVPEYKSRKPDHIQITHQIQNSLTNTQQRSTEDDFKEFERLWKIMLEGVNSDDKIKEMKTLFEQIKKTNEQLSKKLVHKFR